MAILKKAAKKETEEIKAKEPVQVAGLCECGEPVAIELGQNQVCAKHMRRS